MAVSLLWALQVLLLGIALGGVMAAWYSYARYPWHEVNRASRIPVRRTTVDASRYCVSAAFFLFAPLVISGLLSFRGTMARLRARATRGPPEYTVVERIGTLLPWDLVTAGLLALVVLLLFVPLGLVVLDLGRTLLGERDPSGS